jgi:hypothetical protein
LQKSAWKKAGDLPQGYTSAYSEMPGEPSIGMPKKHYKNDQHKRAMNAPIDKTDQIRKAGW